MNVASTHFSYDSNTKVFFGEMSMFDHQKIDLLAQLNEAGEQGFKMISAKTGKVVDFVLALVDREADGDLRSWIFKPSIGDVFNDQSLANVKVMVVNV